MVCFSVCGELGGQRLSLTLSARVRKSCLERLTDFRAVPAAVPRSRRPCARKHHSVPHDRCRAGDVAQAGCRMLFLLRRPGGSFRRPGGRRRRLELVGGHLLHGPVEQQNIAAALRNVLLIRQDFLRFGMPRSSSRSGNFALHIKTTSPDCNASYPFPPIDLTMPRSSTEVVPILVEK